MAHKQRSHLTVTLHRLAFVSSTKYVNGSFEFLQSCNVPGVRSMLTRCSGFNVSYLHLHDQRKRISRKVLSQTTALSELPVIYNICGFWR